MIKCTYCGGTEFLEGPSGGMSTNVLCANKECRHWFNYTELLNQLEDLNRVEPTPEGRLEKERARRQAELSEEAQQYEQGIQLFRAGRSARDCIQDAPYGPCAEVRSNVLRLTGWVDASQEHLAREKPAWIEAQVKASTLSQDEIMKLWREHSGDQFGPHVEHVSMPLTNFFNFITALFNRGTK